MIARVVCLIEVEVGGVRRYFTAEGESIGLAAPDADEPSDVEHAEACIDAAIASLPKRRYVPPFDPGGPGLRMGASDESEGGDA